MNYFDSARQSQIEGFRSERGGLSPCGKDDEEDRFGKVAASQNGLGSCLTVPKSCSFLEALAHRNKGRPPVWLMRQAGRYLPEYRALRAGHSLKEMFFTPALAAKITCMPIERFGLDAAILFSDITALTPALGLSLEFDEGPQIFPSVTRENYLHLLSDLSRLEPVFEALSNAKEALSVPIIGFCGGPFTVATYLIEKHTGSAIPKTRLWMERDPVSFAHFLERLTDLTIAYVQAQVKAGADAIQIFDSWANLLSDEEFEIYSLKLVGKIVEACSVPSIVYMRGSSLRAERIASIQPTAIGLDGLRPIEEVRLSVPTALQGNLEPELLFRPLLEVRGEVRRLLETMRGDPSFIVNVSRGVKPGTPLEAVEALVQEVQRNF
jgi:uroporphyrinogen decarboxylase